MMDVTKICFLALLSFTAASGTQICSKSVEVQTDKGAVAGCFRVAANGRVYASFRGVPYAKQPLGELRFQELLPADPWQDTLNATEEGPVCPQYDTVYGNIPYPDRVMSESCIHANIHVPYDALPKKTTVQSVGIPILVFINGGGFAYGSGDSDLHGPEYLVTKGFIVITFNYRINVFGFLSLNSPVIPGNNGIRDAITLLRWVQTNAARFGGNPNDVTLAGQSAGSGITHILSMIPAAQGLFHRIILMSLTASPLFYSASPTYAQTLTNLFLTTIGINSTDPEDIHRQLIEMPLETLMTANAQVQDQIGVLVFGPVVETKAPNFTTIIDIDIDEMIQQGRGNNIPVIIGFTTVEGETFRPAFEKSGIVSELEANLTSVVVYPKVAIRSTPEVIADVGRRVQEKYFPTITMDNYIKYITEGFFIYPAIRLAKIRAEQAAASTYLYQFSYNNDNNVVRRLNNLTYVGAAHVEDQTYMMRVNTGLPATQLGRPSVEDPMVDRMTSFVANFIKNGAPTDNDSKWKPVSSNDFTYQDIATPDLNDYRNRPLTKSQQEIYEFFLAIENS